MTVEAATYISDFVATSPLADDPVSEGAAHLRLLKTVMQTTFPGVAGAVTSTHTQLNAVASTAAAVTVLQGNRLRNDIDEELDGDLNVTGVISQGGFALVPTGVIVMWSGVAASIPGGWALCDGTAGTPDLRSKFVIGAGTGGSYLAPGAEVGTNSLVFTTGSGGSHSHTGSSGAAGAHTHGASTSADGAHAHGTATGSTVLTVGQLPAHHHDILNGVVQSGSGIAGTGGGVAGYGDLVSNDTGGGEGHAHTISSDGSHTHTVTVAAAADHVHGIATDAGHTHSNTIDNRPASYALAFIMKV